MSRPLFDIAREIAADWANPSTQAKTYLKGLHYLLGMDDRVADLDATTAVRMFLLYSKEWTGPVAERVKAELTGMRKTNAPSNTDLLQADRFPVSDLTLSHCESCDAPLAGKLIDAYTHWKERKRMCQHCALCLSHGVEIGDGAVLIADEQGRWRHLHGTPNASPPGLKELIPSEKSKKIKIEPTFNQRMRFFSRRVIRKCVKVVSGLFRRSA